MTNPEFFRSLTPAFAARPRTQPWNPPRNIGAECVILRPKTTLQRTLLIAHNKQVKAQTDKNSIAQDSDIAQKQPLSQDHPHHGNVHGIAHKAIKSTDHQVTRREN